jgi:peptidoglycan hydrolase-like protein with peptidoglycan-binding domain
MSVSRRAPHAPGLIIAVVLGLLLALPASTHATPTATGRAVADPGTGWHGHAIRDPHPTRTPTRTSTRTSTRGTLATLAPGRGLTSPHGSRAVRALQRHLTQLGYRPGPIDGRYGPRTRDAVTWFQTKHGLTPTGAATPTTRRHLHWRTAAGATRTPAATRTDHARTRPAPPRPESTPRAAIPTQPAAAALSSTALRTILLLLAVAGLTVAAASYRRTRLRLAAAAPATHATAPTPARAPRPAHPHSPVTDDASQQPQPINPAETNTTAAPAPPTIDAGPRSGAALDAAFASTTPHDAPTHHDTTTTTTTRHDHTANNAARPTHRTTTTTDDHARHHPPRELTTVGATNAPDRHANTQHAARER